MSIQKLFCKLKLHWKPYLESAVFSHAMKCDSCGEWLVPAEGARVDRERQWWEAIEKESMGKNPKRRPSVYDQDSDPWGGPDAA